MDPLPRHILYLHGLASSPQSTKAQEFVAQLATFSSLEQLESMNETMQASLLMDTSVNNTLATSLIGKRVLAENVFVELRDLEPGHAPGPQRAPGVRVDLRNASTLVVSAPHGSESH